MEWNELTPQEQWILEQVKEGKVADLASEYGPDPRTRNLRAKFIEDLLTGDIKNLIVHRKGILIAQALIDGFLDLGNAEISHAIVLRYCIFRDEVIFQDSWFKKHLIFHGAQFMKIVNFHRIKVDKSLICRNNRFYKGVDFCGAVIGGQLIAEGAKFGEAGNEYPANFNGIRIGQSATFQKAEFYGAVDFSSADITESLAAVGAKFLGEGEEQKAIFVAIKVGKRAIFHAAEFHGSVDFRLADFRMDLEAPGAKFLGQGHDQKANFSYIKVGQSAFFQGAEFHGPVDFNGAGIGRNFNAEGAIFEGEGKKNEAKFNAMKVGQSASFQGAVFHGPAYFDFVHIGGSLYLNSLQANSGHHETTFHGLAKFGGADIRGQLVAEGAIFQQDADFAGLKVADRAIFKNSVFKRKASWNYANLKDLIINYSETKSIDELNLNNAKIERELLLSRIEINQFKAWNLDSKGSTILAGLLIKEKCDLRESSFQVLILKGVTWPQSSEDVLLEGLTYRAVKAGDRKEDWRKLLNWLKGSRFNSQNYGQLEAYFSRCGHRDRADEVFISGKREAAKRLTWSKKWLTRIFWGGLTGYGRKPWQVLYAILPLVALGTFLFAPEFTDKSLESYGWLNQMKQNHPWIIQFLLSLDRFLPGVDLGLAKEWSPSCVGLFTFAYWYFLKLAGWITIPIALAAIYTRIK